jgi:hypothetical protein
MYIHCGKNQLRELFREYQYIHGFYIVYTFLFFPNILIANFTDGFSSNTISDIVYKAILSVTFFTTEP